MALRRLWFLGSDPAAADEGSAGFFALSRPPKQYPVWLHGLLILLAVAYLWSLPLLRETGFTNTCASYYLNGIPHEYPMCVYDFGVFGREFLVCTGTSVSDYIATPQGTGLLAALLFWPCMHLWMPSYYVAGPLAYWSLLVFQIGFGAFLACPVTKWPTLHMSVVAVFCAAGLVHMLIMLRESVRLLKQDVKAYATMLLAVTSIIAFFSVIFSLLLSVLFTPGFCKLAPYAFYLFESLGLGCMTLFVLVWHQA